MTGLAAPPLLAADPPPCAPRAVVIDRLHTAFGETPRSVGLGANNAMVELFASDESGTWTITATSPDGMTCLLASGEAYAALLPPPGEDA
ncbi:hypothetical protein KM176_13145 [Pseudooceanicola sp. CBS1P-1]|uniref:Uncharacterized protein n=1 Tax=Pseudooceanicola albus TaxID=2692189 RepID=A0A6L7G3W1_9RHOB|nr:hypothetical protein [Pseudooceanicola endophyticus]MXN18197.1 hypothetical protein [Pseudooceanicola albus]